MNPESRAREHETSAIRRLLTTTILTPVILLSFPVLLSRADECHFERRKAADGTDRVTLSNQWLRVEVSPEYGGAVTSFVYLPTGEEISSDQPDQRSLMTALQGYRNEFWRSGYRLEVLKDTPEEVAVALHWTSGAQQAPLKFIQLKRILRLRADESQLDVSVNLHNMAEQMMPVYPLMRFFNSTRFVDQDTAYYIPTEAGVREIPYALHMATREIWEYNPSRGWLAAVGGKGTGFAFDLSECFRNLMCYYLYLGRRQMPTNEWMYRTLPVRDGESLISNFRLMAFGGLKRIDAVGDGVAVELTVDEVKPAARHIQGKVRLAFTRNREVSLTARIAKTRGSPADKALHQTISGRTGDLKEVPFRFETGGEGTYVLTGRITEGKKLVCDFQRVVNVGKLSAEVVWKPIEKRLGDPNQRWSHARPGLLPSTARKDLLSWDPEANITPHLKWAKPLADGPIKALVLCDHINGREVLELAQRVDIKFDTFTMRSGFYKFWYYVDREENAKKLADYIAKKPHDVVVLGGISGQYLKAAGQKALLEYLNKGGGLVYIMPNQLPESIRAVMPLDTSGKLWRKPPWRADRPPQSVWRPTKQHYLTAGFPFEVMPPVYAVADVAKGEVLIRDTNGRPVLAVGKVGKGRIVAFGYGAGWVWNYHTGLTPWIRNAPVQFDYHEYYFSLLAKAICYAAGRPPAVELTGLSASDTGELSVALRADKAGDVTIAAEWTDRFGRVLGQKRSNMSLKPGTTQKRISAPLQLHLDGVHLVRARILDSNKILDWGAASFVHKSPARIAGLSVPERFYRSFQKIPVRVELVGKDRVKAKLSVDVIDLHERLIAREERTFALSDRMTLNIPVSLPRVIAQSAEIRARLSDGEHVISEARRSILLTTEEMHERAWDDWLVTIWGGPDGRWAYEYFYPQIARRLRAAGVSVCAVSTNGKKPWTNLENQAGLFHRMGFRAITVESLNRNDWQDQKIKEKIQQYAKTRDKKYLERNPCLNDPKVRARFDSMLQTRLSEVAAYSPLAYDFGDEMSYTYYKHAHDFDFSPHSIRAFREWLRSEYKTIANLNASWETKFKAWDDVMPMTEEEVRKHTSFAPWCDQRTFNEVTVEEVFRDAVNKVKSLDPKARCGISGTQRPVPHNAYDYSRFMRIFDAMMAYVHSPWVSIAQRSFGSARLTFWMNNDNTRQEYFRRAWEQFLRGYNGCSNCTEHSLVNPDLTLRYDFKDYCDANRQFTTGLGKLMMSYRRAPNVAIHYSQASNHVTWMAKCPERYKTTNEAWVSLLSDLGYSAVYLDERSLVAGELDQYGIFVLPMSMAISAAEADAIRAFAKRGGLLLTDAYAGWTDEHGNRGRGGKLDDVLGLHFEVPEGELPDSPKGQEVNPAPGRTLFLPVASARIRLKGAKPRLRAGTTPIFLVNQFGHGKAVTLNAYVSGYVGQRKRGAGSEWREALRSLLALSHVKPLCRVTNPDGSERAATDRGYFTDRENGLLLLLTQTQNVPADEAVVELPSEKYVTDILAERAFGLARRVRVTLKPFEGCALSLLSYQVRGVRIKAPESAKAGEEVKIALSIDAGDAQVGRHVLRCSVLGPDGKALTYYTRNLLAENGKGELILPLALDAKPGTYTLRARDVASAVANEATFTVARATPKPAATVKAAPSVILRENFDDLANWRRVHPKSPTSCKIENNTMLLGTGSVGMLLKKNLPEEFVITLKAKNERWMSDDKFKGHTAWIKIQLYVHPGNRGEKNPDFYDVCFAPERGFVYVYKYTQLPPNEPSTWRKTMKLVSEKAGLGTRLGRWYDIRIEVRKQGFGMYLDGEEVASVATPDDAFHKGTIGLLGGESGSAAYFKDLAIRKP